MSEQAAAPVPRRSVSTHDLLSLGICYEDAMDGVTAQGGKIEATYEEAEATLNAWADDQEERQTKWRHERAAGLRWLREHFDDDEPAETPDRIPFSSRSKFGSGRGDGAYGFGDESNWMRVPYNGVQAYGIGAEPGRGYGRR